MFQNADTLLNGSILSDFDICIAGAGVAGLVIASRFAGGSTRVLVLCDGLPSDTGPDPDPTRQLTYLGSPGPFLAQVDPGAGTDPGFIRRSRLNKFGGTSNHFWFNSYPLEEADLVPRPGYRDAQWPISIEELNRYYPAANTFGDFGPFNYADIAFWAEAFRGIPFPPLAGDPLKNVVWRGQQSACTFQFQTQLGPLLKSAGNVLVLFNAHVLRVESTADRSHAVSLDCGTIRDGQPGIFFTAEARFFVLALGGIEPVRLLKLSGDLGDNAAGHLGQGFMLHPVIWDAASIDIPEPVPRVIENFYRGGNVIVQDPSDDVPCHTVVKRRLFDPTELDGRHALTAWSMLAPTPEAMAANQIGAFHTQLMFEDTQIGFSMNWESVANPQSTISLDTTQNDPIFNQPIVHVDWNLMETEKRTIRVGLDLVRQFFTARGATNFQIHTKVDGPPDQWIFDPTRKDLRALRTGDHHMGALRMSALPEDGIVDRNCRVHTVDNLYVSGSGVFPTTGHSNPTLTIVALALRLADYLNGLV